MKKARDFQDHGSDDAPHPDTVRARYPVRLKPEVFAYPGYIIPGVASFITFNGYMISEQSDIMNPFFPGFFIFFISMFTFWAAIPSYMWIRSAIERNKFDEPFLTGLEYGARNALIAYSRESDDRRRALRPSVEALMEGHLRKMPREVDHAVKLFESTRMTLDRQDQHDREEQFDPTHREVAQSNLEYLYNQTRQLESRRRDDLV